MHEKNTVLSRFAVLALAVLLCVCHPAFPALAEGQEGITIFLAWEQGSVQANRLGYSGYEDAFWGYIPYEYFGQPITLYVNDESGRYTSFDPGSGFVLQDYADAGNDIASAVSVDIQSYDYFGTPGPVFRLYLSSMTDKPYVPQIVAPQVPVYYRDAATWMEISGNSQVTCTVNAVTAVTAPEIAGYRLQGSDTQYVTVDSFGTPDASEIVFYYETIQVPQVTVRYLDQNTYAEIKAADLLPCQLGQSMPVFSAEIPGYQVVGDAVQYVSVDANGSADRQEVLFYYAAISAPVLPVRYLDQATGMEVAPAGNVTCALNQMTEVNAVSVDGYQLTGDAVQYVSVDANGNADRQKVLFYYSAISAPVLPVRYLDQATGMEIAPSESVTCPLNAVTTVRAAGVNGYEVIGNAEQEISVDANGNAIPSEIVFRYASIPLPEVTVRYLDAASGIEVLPSAAVSCPLNTYTEFTAPEADGYLVLGESTVSVWVDANGNANATEVVFRYQQLPPYALKVTYVDAETGAEIADADEVLCEVGAVTEIAAPAIFGYRLADAQTKQVTVDGRGFADESEIAFHYTAIPLPAVEIWYVDTETGKEIADRDEVICPLNETTTVQAARIPGYAVEGEEQQEIYADADGNAEPERVVFQYSAVEGPTLPIYYLDQVTGMELAPTDQVTLPLNADTLVTAVLVPGYLVSGEGQVTVHVDAYGQADQSKVEFRYVPAERPEITVRCLNLENGEALVEERKERIPLNHDTLFTAPEISGWCVFGESQAMVHADAYGYADKTLITFYYERVTDPIITVNYRSSVTGQELLDAETVKCPVGETTVIRAKEISGYVLIGDAEQAVTVAFDGTVESDQVVFYYSTIPAPTVTVSYVFEDGTKAAEDDTITCPLNQVTEISARSLIGCRVVGDHVMNVTVDENGVADRTEITFVYTSIPDPEVLVRYVDAEDETPLADSEIIPCPIGERTPVYARNINGYQLNGQSVKYVNVDGSGVPDSAEIVFQYTRLAAQPVLVPIIYRDMSHDNAELYSTTEVVAPGESARIEVELDKVDAQYELMDDAAKTVSVGVSGVAIPAEVVFYFREKAQLVVSVPVYYVDEAGLTVASTGIADCFEGSNAIAADPVDLETNCELVGPSTQYLIVYPDGSTDQEAITFVYRRLETPSPAPSPTPYVPYAIEEENQYMYPTYENAYYRSSPDTASMDNVIRSVAMDEPVHVTGSLINDRGENWYRVQIGSSTGYMNANVLREMTQAEINTLFGYTPTPAPTPIPDGAAIDRWGTVNSKNVRFRKTAQKNGSVIDTLSAGNKVWIYESATSDDTQWYSIRYKGQDGYMMAKFVDMMTETESAAMQEALPTPMITRTPPATQMPTSVVTPSPTPTATPQVTETPLPTAMPEATEYQGYALTVGKAYLYNSMAGYSDDSVLSQEEANTLVLINSMTSIDGVRWDSVEIYATQKSGFMLDDDLRYISNEEARRHLNQQPTALVSSPVPTDEPAQRKGYAMTVGANVVIRAFADTNAQIYQALGEDTVVIVYGQEYAGGQTWDLVSYGSSWGYIRDDQVRMLNDLEVVGYLESLRTPTPLPQATPTAAPVTGSSLSSYGYVTVDRVNLRSEASKSSRSIRMLNQYAFALVLGTVTNEEGETWYHVMQSGTEGFIQSKYFMMLTLDQLSAFLTSDDYINSVSNDGTINNSSVSSLQPYEDYNRTVWQNPALNASYAPFVVGTPTPGPSFAAATASPTPFVSSSPMASETAQPLPTDGAGGIMVSARPSQEPVSATAEPAVEERSGSENVLPFVVLGAALALGGGGAYAYSIHRKNERRRRALREQQARRAQAQRSSSQARPNAQTQARDIAANQMGNTVVAPRGRDASSPSPVVRNASDTQMNGGTGVYDAARVKAAEETQLNDWTRKAEVKAPRPEDTTIASADAYRKNALLKDESETTVAGWKQTGADAANSASAGEKNTGTPERRRRSDRHQNEPRV